MVVYPDNTEDVVSIMKVATKYRMPVVVYGGGTGLEGNFSAVCPSFDARHTRTLKCNVSTGQTWIYLR